MISVYKNLVPSPMIYISIPPPIYHKGHGIREDVVNEVLPRVILQISHDAKVQLVDVFSALGGASRRRESDFILAGNDLLESRQLNISSN